MKDDDRAFHAERRAEKWEAACKIIALFFLMGFGTIFIAGGVDAVLRVATGILASVRP
jgi:hypothetical protein